MDSKTFWNSNTITNYFGSKPADPRISAFLEGYDHAQGTSALDLGCGGGRHAELLARLGFELHAVDVNPEMLATTRRRLAHNNQHGDVREGSILHIPFGDAVFDIVVTTGVLHQARSVAEYDRAIGELARVMKPGAYVLLNIFTNKVWDDSYTLISDDGLTVRTKENLLMTLLPRQTFVNLMVKHSLQLSDEQAEDIKAENTGPRAVYRAFFKKASHLQPKSS